MYLKFLSISILILLLNDLLFFYGFKPLLRKYNLRTRKWIIFTYWAFTFYSILLLSFAVYHYIEEIPPPKFARVYLSGFTFIVLASKVIGNAFFIINWLVAAIRRSYSAIRKEKFHPSRRKFIRKVGVASALLPFFTLNYGMLFGAFNFSIRRKKVEIPDLPEDFEGLKVLQISDIHCGSFVSESPLETAVNMIMKEQADVIVFTGDLVNEIAEEARPFVEVLKKISAPLGVFSILGNHDYGDYFYDENDVSGKRHNRELMKDIHYSMGWKLLNNEHVILRKGNGEIGLIGSENWGNAARFPKYGNLKEARKNMKQLPVNILLTHDPSHWEAEVLDNHQDIQLTLSGHTHGFQMGVEIPGFRWSPSQYLYKQWAGLYRSAQQFIYVNRGLGFIGYPGRLGISPEITVLNLHRKA